MSETILYDQPGSDPTVISPAGRALCDKVPFIDMHTHAGRRGGYDAIELAVIDSMRPSGVAVAVMAAIPDTPVVKRRDTGLRSPYCFREPEAGECMAATEKHLQRIEALFAGGKAFRITEPEHVAACMAQPLPGAVLAIEGCDFLEGDLGRLDWAASRGVRSIQPVHYRINELGDIQTEPPRHGGLTAFGRAAVQRMDDLGILLDVSHATEATARGVAEASRNPILCTHSNLQDEPGHPRFISPDYARMVAATGGVIGAWAAAFQGRGLAGMIEHMFRLIDCVGIDHVGIGTDMGAGAAEAIMPDFRRYPALATALLDRGLGETEAAKVLGGNWLRCFTAVRARRKA